MPNWCRNRVTVSGTEEDISKISDIFSDTKSIFNRIIQSPDWKRLPNEKGEFPKLEQMKNPKGEIMWETYNLTTSFSPQTGRDYQTKKESFQNSNK